MGRSGTESDQSDLATSEPDRGRIPKTSLASSAGPFEYVVRSEK